MAGFRPSPWNRGPLPRGVGTRDLRLSVELVRTADGSGRIHREVRARLRRRPIAFLVAPA